MNIPLLDLHCIHDEIRDEIRVAIDEVCDTQRFILGPKVEALETEIADYCGVPHACGVTSGSDALLIALMAEGIGQGDEVITTPFTFFATAGAVARVGATPVFVDIEPGTCNIDPARIEDRITSSTRAIIPVHLFGQPADMEPIVEIARRYDLIVIEDAAQAIGAEYRGRRSGSIGHYGCFSFFPSKNLGAFGDGGMVTCDTAERHQQLMTLRGHGAQPKYYHKFIGGNFRLDALQAAIVSVKLRHLDDWTAQRQTNSERYRAAFAAARLDAAVVLPEAHENTTRHAWNVYTVRLTGGRRDEVRSALGAAGVGAEVYYPVALHCQDCFSYLGIAPEDCPESVKAAGEVLSLPIFPGLTEEQIQYIVDQIATVV